jgi:AcrR family transcriptional regulator
METEETITEKRVSIVDAMMVEGNNSRERILSVAVELFSKFGIRSVSMDDLAHQLGISKKTIYLHFSDKDDIITLATEQYLREGRDFVKGLNKESHDSIDALIKINTYMNRNNRETTASLLFDLQKYHPKAWHMMEAFKKNFLSEIVRVNLEKGIVAGLFREDIHPDISTRIRLEEASMVFNEELFPRSKFNLNEVSETLLAHFILGISTEKGRRLYKKYKDRSGVELDLN